jgi:hypothetical protein
LVVYGLARGKPLLAAGKIGTVFFSADVGKSTRREMDHIRSAYPDTALFELPDREEMRELSDKEKVKVLAIKRSKMLVKINALAKTIWSSDGKEI